MGLHERAWAGLNLLIYGKTPMLPMQLEQAVAAASPENEVRVDSFEDYGDALDYSKDKQSVGFIFLLEDCGELPLKDVFSQLSKSYENKGWPCFGILLYENTESIKGLRTLQECPNILAYQSIKSLLDPSLTVDTLNSIWTKFNSLFQDKVIPLPLQQTFLSIAETQISQTSIHFMDRVSALLSSNLNVSWIETLSMRWSPVISAIEKSGSNSAISPHPTLLQICNLSKYGGSSEDVSEIVASKESLCRRVVALTSLLEKKRAEGILQEFLQKMGTFSRPGAPALLRHAVNNRDRILAIAHEEEQATHLEHTG